MIVIVDTGVANFNSVLFALKRIGATAEITQDLSTIRNASHVILPGVGTASAVMERLQALKITDVLKKLEQPVLGICLGMQVLYAVSAEYNTSCLGLLKGNVEPLASSIKAPVPHMGWNQVIFNKSNCLFKGIEQGSYFYFVHSYRVSTNLTTCATTRYGIDFTAACQWKNYYGTQFHPERSGIVGTQLLKNFLEL